MAAAASPTDLLHRPVSRRGLLRASAGVVAAAGASRLILPAAGLAAPGAASPLLVPAAVALSGATGTINVPTATLRSSASLGAGIVGYLANGTPVSVLRTSSDWFKVAAAGRTGWTNSWNVTLNGTPSRVISRGNTGRGMVALTFDAGSDLGSTQEIIETLEYQGIIASFGLTGAWMNAFGDYAAWIRADGHQLINHTLNHWSYTGYSAGARPLSPAKRLSQLAANESLLTSIAGAGARPYWRPPYGDYDSSVLRDVGAIGYRRTVLWTVDSMGWAGWTADQIYAQVMGKIGNGAIVLMHVGGASADHAALRRIITAIRSRGYAFGTVAQAIA